MKKTRTFFFFMQYILPGLWNSLLLEINMSKNQNGARKKNYALTWIMETPLILYNGL